MGFDTQMSGLWSMIDFKGLLNVETVYNIFWRICTSSVLASIHPPINPRDNESGNKVKYF